MKRVLMVLIAFTLLSPAVSHAQSPEAAAAIANKQAEEERYRRLASQLEDLQAVLQQQAKKIEELTTQLASLREEHAKRDGKTASLDALSQLANDIQEVDKKRMADSKLIRDELAKILKAVSEATPASAGGRRKPPMELKVQSATEGDVKDAANSQKVYEYIVQKDDTLSAIVAAYRAQGVKVTLDDVLKANPGLEPTRMTIGQKIIVPIPGN